MINLLWNVLREDEAQDIAEYAVMLAVNSCHCCWYDPFDRF